MKLFNLINMNRIELLVDEVKNRMNNRKNISFLETFIRRRYNDEDLKREFYSGLREGIFIGFEKSSLDGQKIELNLNIKNIRHKEFIDKFYSLCDEYKCDIQWNEKSGLCVIDKKENVD